MSLNLTVIKKVVVYVVYIHEMLVAWNGPEIGNGDELLERALNRHFSNSRNGIHFKTNTLFKTAGPTVEKIFERKNKTYMY